MFECLQHQVTAFVSLLFVAGQQQVVCSGFFELLFAANSCLLLLETRLMRAPRLNHTFNSLAFKMNNELKEARNSHEDTRVSNRETETS